MYLNFKYNVPSGLAKIEDTVLSKVMAHKSVTKELKYFTIIRVNS
jgi:hypothetical protein